MAATLIDLEQLNQTNLSSWDSITRASGFDTFVTTPSSANLKSLVTDETGSGALVFGTNPMFTTGIAIDNTSAFYKLDILANTQNGSEAIGFTHFTAAVSTSPQFFMQRARGTSSIPTALNSGDDLGYLSFRGHTGSAFTGTRASLRSRTTELWSTTANGTELVFSTTPNTTTGVIDVGKFLNDGNLHLLLSTSAIYLGNITPSSTNYALKYTNTDEVSLNATSTLRFRCGGTIFATGSSTDLTINGSAGLSIANNSNDTKITFSRTSGNNHSFQLSTTDCFIFNNTASAIRYGVTNAGNFYVGAKSALATTATDGFLYLPSCAGIPTGVPTAITGKVPIVVDSTNNKAYIYSGGAWVALN